MSLRDRPSTASIPSLSGAGVPFVAGAAELGVALQATKSFALSGASPHTIDFEDLLSQTGKPIRAPLDTDYLVICVGDSASVVDLSTRTRTSIGLTGGSALDVVSLIIIGRFGAMVR